MHTMVPLCVFWLTVIKPGNNIQEELPNAYSDEFINLDSTMLSLEDDARKINQALTHSMISSQLGYAEEAAAPNWVVEICPEVVEHYKKYPTFTSTVLSPPLNTSSSVMDNKAATMAVCTLKLFKALASSLGHHIYLHAGSHLGAVVHGQPIPWDDDLDLFLDHRFIDEVGNACNKLPPIFNGCAMKCFIEVGSSMRVWVDDGRPKITVRQKQWNSPFLDVFPFKIENSTIDEISGGDAKVFPMPLKGYFPARPYYFGGIYVLGPRAAVSQDRYNLKVCQTGHWDHMHDRGGQPWFRNKRLNCTALATKFPFIGTSLRGDLGVYINGQKEQNLIPESANDVTHVPKISEDQWAMWSNADGQYGQLLTEEVPDLNTVEIDNSIASHDECQARGGKLTVVEYNAERGRWWLEALDILNDIEADIIILNEMDIGMARSDQQHTTRLMAHHLKMNYIFGIEFVELTLGTIEEKNENEGGTNFHGLHGNAILTKCFISDGKIFRDNIGQYFSNTANGVNARGHEKRLGGRMGLFGRILVGGQSVVIGSVHKVGSQDVSIKEYINSTKAIVAGDQDSRSCPKWGLQVVGAKEGNTWPASCDSLGRGRGDHICSNLKKVENRGSLESVIKPCVTVGPIRTQIGDHAIIQATFLI